MKLGYDSPEQFRRELRRIHRLGWRRLFAASAYTAAGIVMIAIIAGLTTQGMLGYFWFTGIPIVGVVVMCATGLLAFIQAGRLAVRSRACFGFR